MRKTTITLMMWGREIKSYAANKAGVILCEIMDMEADGRTAAVKKMKERMERDINEVFEIFKFSSYIQYQQIVDTWYKRVKRAQFGTS